MACDHLPALRRTRWRGASLVLAPVGAAALLAASGAHSATPRARSPRAAAPHYRLTDLGAPEGAVTCGATAVNASGQVVGYWRASGTTPTQGFTWDAAHGMRVLARLPGSLAALPLALNDAGEIAGIGVDSNGVNHAVLWDSAGAPHDLGSFTGRNALAAGLNNPTSTHGTQVVGTAIGADGRYRPFIWDAQGGMRDIGPTAPNEASLDSAAWAINDAGQVTGLTYAAIGSHQYVDQTFRWDAVNGLQDVDPTDQPSIGYDINAAGNIVGKVNTTAPGYFTQVLGIWDGSGPSQFNDVQPTVSIDDDATAFIRPMGINAAGDVAYTDVNFGGAALFSGGVRQNLKTLTTLPAGYVLKSATDINDAGQIVGTMHTGEAWHAYLLTPGAGTSADLEVTQTASASSAPVGQNVTYTLTVKNLGADAARVVTLTDTVQGTSEIVSTTPAVTPVNEQLTFDLGTLAAGASQTITVTVKGQFAGTTLISQAAVSSGDTDPNPANNSVSTSVAVTEAPPAAQADLGVTLTASPTVVQVGKTVTLTAVVTNHGPNAASGVTLTPNAGGVALAPISIGALGVNKSVMRTFTVTPTASGTLSITATVAGNEADANGGDNTASASITVQNVPPTPKPDLSGQWSGVGIVRSGSAKKPVYTLTGTLTVRNGGTATAAATTATFAASTDGVLDSSDLLLMTSPKKAVTLKIPALKAGAGKAFKFSFRLPAGMSPSVLTGLNVIATIDAGNKVAELDETNNLAVGGPIQ